MYEGNSKFNFLPHILREACEDAKTADKTSKTKLLRGLPISIKQCQGVKRADANVGLSKYAGIVFEKDWSQRSKPTGHPLLQNEHIPQTLLSYECSSPMYGTTLNPQNPQRTGRQQLRGGCGAVVRGFLPRD